MKHQPTMDKVIGIAQDDVRNQVELGFNVDDDYLHELADIHTPHYYKDLCQLMLEDPGLGYAKYDGPSFQNAWEIVRYNVYEAVLSAMQVKLAELNRAAAAN